MYYERHSDVGLAFTYNVNGEYKLVGLKKKVILLHHFRKHILDGVSFQFIPDPSGQLGNDYECIFESDSPLIFLMTVYVKKWTSSKRSILFALSNGIVQVGEFV